MPVGTEAFASSFIFGITVFLYNDGAVTDTSFPRCSVAMKGFLNDGFGPTMTVVHSRDSVDHCGAGIGS
jgi:hypothetical protein